MTPHDHQGQRGSGSPAPGQSRFGVGQLLVFLGILVLYQVLFAWPHAETLSYSEFKTPIGAGKVREVLVAKDVVDRDALLEVVKATGTPASAGTILLLAAPVRVSALAMPGGA